jgi:anti-sigma regulatory factor (Ser/Thr protein kinase)
MGDRSANQAAEMSGSLQLANHPTAAREGRHYVRECLDGWGVHTEVIDVVTLLTSEVITNAVRHAPPPLELRLHRHDLAIRVEVTDSVATPPQRIRPDLDSSGGRGLWLLDALALAWGHYTAGEGKRVWFEVRTDRST